MLKWAMRIVAVGGALLALAVGTAAWMHRTLGRDWFIATPSCWSRILISPQYVEVEGWPRREWNPYPPLKTGQYNVFSNVWDNSYTRRYFQRAIQFHGFGKEWHGFGFGQGTLTMRAIPNSGSILCPTWSLIAVLLLPTGLWAGIGWQQRRRAAGHCINCGYDLRASPERCPECGREVKK